MAVNNTQRKSFKLDALMRLARMRQFGNIHMKIDPHTGLQAIIAIHNTDLGPAIGGCRLFPYHSTGQALKDVLDLAHMMTLKAAANKLPHGGAKSVIIKPKGAFNRKKLFESFGEFVHELNGCYIAACDSGTSTDDMNIISTRTPYVIGATSLNPVATDPARHTALGVFQGIRAAVKYRLQRDNLQGLIVNIQGVGKVGYHLCHLLHQEGAILRVSDTHQENVQKAFEQFNAQPVGLDEIYNLDGDVFSPCAMGGILNHSTINQLQTSIVAGSANSQLAHRKYATMLKEKNILYAPDFVINSGGLIDAAYVYDYQDAEIANKHILALFDYLCIIFKQAEQQKQTTLAVAMTSAQHHLAQTKQGKIAIMEHLFETIN